LTRIAPKLPRLLLEDRLRLLRGLVLFAWVLFVAFVGIEWLLRTHSGATWPTVAGFSLTYNLLLFVFGVNTVVLTGLLVRCDWFERVPRNAEYRVSWLLALVLTWLGLYLFFLFHISGAFSGALATLPATLVLAALVMLPGIAGWATAAYLVVGHLLVAWLADNAMIHPSGPLAEAFDEDGVLRGASLFAIFAIALSVALAARAWMFPHPLSNHQARRMDPETGLFRPHFLRERLQRELGRARRQGSVSTLLLLDISDAYETLSEREAERAYADVLMKNIRLNSDTPASFALGQIAVLMPAADASAAQALFERLQAAAHTAGLKTPRAAGAVAESAAVAADQMIASAEAALAGAVTDELPPLTRL